MSSSISSQALVDSVTFVLLFDRFATSVSLSVSVLFADDVDGSFFVSANLLAQILRMLSHGEVPDCVPLVVDDPSTWPPDENDDVGRFMTLVPIQIEQEKRSFLFIV